MQTREIIKQGTFGKIVLEEDTIPYREVLDSGWYDTSSVYLCLKAINELRKDYGNINIADIGSNPGFYTIPFARNTGGIVYSFGLNSEMRSLLTRSILINRLQNVLVFDKLPTMGGSEKKDSYSLDSLDMQNLRFIKFELRPKKIEKIIQGTKKLINNFHPVFYFSFPSRFFIKEASELNSIFYFLRERQYFAILFADGFMAIPERFFWAYYPHYKDKGLIIAGDYDFAHEAKKSMQLFSMFQQQIQKKMIRLKNLCYKFRWKYRLYKTHYI